MFKLFKKDLILFFHDQRSVILTFLLPVILISLFAFAYGGIGLFDGRSEPVNLLVADLDQSRSSKEIVYKIDSLKDIKILSSDALKAKELVIKGKYACALIIYEGFQDSLEAGNATRLELVYDRSREMEIGILQQTLISTIMSSTGRIIVNKSIENYLNANFPAIDKRIVDNILRTAIKNNSNALTIKWTSVVGEKNDTKLGLIQAVAGTAIPMCVYAAGMAIRPRGVRANIPC